MVGDCGRAECLAVHQVLYAAGRALVEAVDTERLDVLSLGSQQDNRHVHWHLVPLPPGAPYDEQQAAARSVRNGWLDISAAEQAELAVHLRAGIAHHLPAC